MPVKFCIETAALQHDISDTAPSTAHHRRVIDLWLKHGVLSLPSNKEIFDTVATLPQSRRKLWEEALLSEWFRKFQANVESFEPFIQSEETLPGVKPFADLAILENTRAQCICLGEAEFSKVYEEHQLEVCRLDCIDQSVSFRKEAELWNRQIFLGEDRDAIWSERFEGLVRFSRRVSVIDRYCGKRANVASTKNRMSGLTRLVRYINSVADAGKPKTLSIFSSDVELDVEMLKASITKEISVSRKNLASVHLFITPDQIFTRYSHDRYIRFDALVAAYGKGLSLLESKKCNENISCSLFVDLDREFRDKVEGKLRTHAAQFVLL